MRYVSSWLLDLLVERTNIRLNRLSVSYSLDDVEISQIPEKTLRRLRIKLRVEEDISKILEEIQEYYKETSRTAQLALDKYPNALASAIHVVESDLEKATEALRHLERETAHLRKVINSLLRTVHLSEVEAWSYLKSIPGIDM
jgi:hypothetical protein